MKLKRYSTEPVISPNPAHAWESLVTTNPAAWYDAGQNKVLMLYRASGNDPEHVIHLGLAESTDGFNFTRVSDDPVMSPLPGTLDGGCIEDPRLVKMDGWYYLTYAARPFPNGQYWMNGPERYRCPLREELPSPFGNNGMITCLAFSQDLRHWIRGGIITNPNQQDHDVILFPEKINGRYFYLHRPELCGPEYGCDVPSIWLADCENPLRLENSRLLAVPEYDWEGIKIGANAPPIRTEAGWLVIYHGVGLDKYYRLGAMLLDLENPDRVIGRTREPIFEPEAWFELKGHHNYKGVVFPCGNVVIDGELIVYYGGADKYVGAASCRLDELLKEISGGNA